MSTPADMPGISLPRDKADHRGSNLVILLLILFIAGVFRLPGLDSPGYELDELWTAEIASGRGSVHVDFPVNQIMQAPELFRLANAAPWWKVWSRMQVTHPPLYYITLRLWMNALGQGDGIERSYAAVASLVAIALLFDTVCRTNGRSIAIWACLLMSVAPLQIDYARKTRNYALALVMILGAANALVRIEKFGASRWRLFALMLFVLAIPLTHYLCIGATLALAAYAVLRLKGQTRMLALGMFTISGILFAIVWAPFFRAQLPLFSLDDPGVSFIKDAAAGHIPRIIQLFLLVPAKMLVPRLHLHCTAYAMAALYVLPFLLLRRNPGLLMWALLLSGIAGALLLLDLCRPSAHLGFVRYIFFAGPPVYVLIPAMGTAIRPARWLTHAMAITALLLCAWFIRDGYQHPAADPHLIADALQSSISPDDIVVFASSGDLFWTRGDQALMFFRYVDPLPCPVVFLDQPAGGPLLRRLQSARSLVVFTSPLPPEAYLPGFVQTSSKSFYYWGTVTVMTPSTPRP